MSKNDLKEVTDGQQFILFLTFRQTDLGLQTIPYKTVRGRLRNAAVGVRSQRIKRKGVVNILARERANTSFPEPETFSGFSRKPFGN